MSNVLSVREITHNDVPLITNYWLTASASHLNAMGVDVYKMPSAAEWKKMLYDQLNQPYKQKKAYCIIWLIDGVPVGHSNINKIQFGKEAYMHLHLWNVSTRAKGSGVRFIQMSLPYYFKNYQLDTLYCEPYALNPAPNKTLPKAGFDFVKQYRTIPGFLNAEQEVNLWQLTKEAYVRLYKR
ncbi:GNAT family N-acetyltransferase [Panacibacter sp. DH6]|uniref:GNAT family N-acetyltransferase n=1 Tax=Panacibacter microcysteis TaxID=2793269 RepID=A0A931E7U7_9BACT|nr:GNAT family protein [Panacibacter microcysteis]MBG9376703.1 GNAT family N-acetyltransferase [Panacibacter microcysteis]